MEGNRGLDRFVGPKHLPTARDAFVLQPAVRIGTEAATNIRDTEIVPVGHRLVRLSRLDTQSM